MAAIDAIAAIADDDNVEMIDEERVCTTEPAQRENGQWFVWDIPETPTQIDKLIVARATNVKYNGLTIVAQFGASIFVRRTWVNIFYYF